MAPSLSSGVQVKEPLGPVVCVVQIGGVGRVPNLLFECTQRKDTPGNTLPAESLAVT